jgi:hypothetical protein
MVQDEGIKSRDRFARGLAAAAPDFAIVAKANARARILGDFSLCHLW